MDKPVPQAQADVLRRMYDVFQHPGHPAMATMMTEALHPEVDWPNVAENTRLHGHEEVRAYWQAQFEVGHPLVSLEGLALGTDGRTVATVRTGLRDAEEDHWAEEPVEHVYTFERDL